MPLAGLILSGCVTVSQAPATHVFQNLSPTPTIANLTAVSGKQTKIGFASSINPDCSVKSIPEIRILTPPSHGVAQVVPMKDTVFYPPGSPYYQCSQRLVDGTSIFYASNPEYRGTDFLTFEIITAEGVDMTRNTIVTVR